jgi:hypothetical protein
VSGKPKTAGYLLPHGIQVVGEYAPRGSNRYWRLRLRPHRFFPGVRAVNGAIHVRRSRVMLAAKLGRALTPQEFAHHEDENRGNDSMENLRLVSAAAHNRHHKVGSRHSEASRRKIGESLKRAYTAGKHRRKFNRDERGRIVS